jgi:hypothetical protein
MNNNLPIETLSKIIKLRNILDGISQISWSFSILNKSHPIGTIDNEMDADTISQAYIDLINEARFLLDKQV